MSPLQAGACLLVLGALPAAGFGQAFMATPSEPLMLETCVGTERYQLNAGSDSVVLDDADRQGVQSALLERYPAFGRDGSAISAIVLWRKPGIGWVYLALKTHPDKPGKVCSAASFSAGVFGFSAELQRKYFDGTRS